MLNNPKVTLGSNVRSILQEAMGGRESSINYDDYIGGVGNIPADIHLLGRMFKERGLQTAEDMLNFFGSNIDAIIKNPQLRGLYKKKLEEEQMERISKGEIPEYVPFDFFKSPLREGDMSYVEAQLSGMKNPEELDEMYRAAQLQSEIDDLDKPSQTDMESDVTEELPTEEIAANTIETQDSVDELPSDVDTQADLERRIKEGQAQAELDKVDRSTLTKKEREDRIREDIDETEFVVSKEQQDKFFADEQKYIKDLAIAETFGGQKFKDYLGSIGKQLVRTGSFMGIPLGTADFVESEEGKRAAEAKLEGEFAIEQLKQTGEDTSGIELKPSEFLKVGAEIQEEVPFFEGNIQAVKLLEKAIDIVEKNPDTVTGARGLFSKYVDDVRNLMGMGVTNFDKLPPYVQVATIIETIRQKNLQAVLGESGRTISDRDRQIITKVFGDLRSGFASTGELKKLLLQSLAGFKESGKAYQVSIRSNLAMVKADPRYRAQAEPYYDPKFDKYNLDYDALTEAIINTKRLLDTDIIDIDL